MGHHHHRGGFGRYRGGLPTGWPVALGLTALLLAYGAIDGLTTYRVYAHGTHGMGVVTRVFDGTTIMEVEGRVCAVTGEYGHVGGMLPVAFPPGRPGSCVVRELRTFRWPLGAVVVGSAILAAYFFARRAATSGPTT